MISNIEVITIGSELLDGRCTDTHTTWLGSQLRPLGHHIRHHQTVLDRLEDISDAIERASKRSDLVVITGGLRPTQDDITFEALAKATQTQLVFHADIYDTIQAAHARKKRRVPASSKRQALLPQGATPLHNHLGMAPGIRITFNNALIFALPGVPHEMKGMFDMHVLPEIKPNTDSFKLAVSFLGLPEAVIEEKILNDLHELELSSSVDYSVTTSFPLVHFQFRIPKSQTENQAQRLKERFFLLYSQHLWHFNEKSIEEHIVLTLKERGWLLHVAESMTGGMLSSALVGVPGCSHVFSQGLITYQAPSKISLLKVAPATLDQFGTISEQCTLEMARGLLKHHQADVAVAITGVAGPNPMPQPSPAKDLLPVGRTYVGLVGPGFEEVKTWTFGTGRHRNRVLATHHALLELYGKIKIKGEHHGNES